MITDGTVGLRALEEADLPLLRDWRNRADYRRYFREYRELNLTMQKTWFAQVVVSDPRTLMFGIVDVLSDDLVGVCGLCYINWVHRHADLSLYIGRDGVYIDEGVTGFAWHALDLLFGYAFGELGLRKVWTEIYAFDEKKHRLFEAYGFHLDGVLRDNYFYSGEFQDSHVFSVLATEWPKGSA